MNNVITTAPSMGTVILLGLAIVFTGLICIVFLCKLMSTVLALIPEKTADSSAKPAAPKTSPKEALKFPKIQKAVKATDASPAAPAAPAAPAVTAAPAAPAAPAANPNRGAIIAAISAAIAEENGTDVSRIRILSIKRV